MPSEPLTFSPGDYGSEQGQTVAYFATLYPTTTRVPANGPSTSNRTWLSKDLLVAQINAAINLGIPYTNLTAALNGWPGQPGP